MPSKTVDRRGFLQLLGSSGALLFTACGVASVLNKDVGSDGGGSDAGGGLDAGTDTGVDAGASSDAGSSAADAGLSPPDAGGEACVTTPEETAGPYPDKTGMLQNQTYYRSDITEGKAGTPLDLRLSIRSLTDACAPVANASVTIWQCDAAGNYSEYSQPGYNGTGTTFLRGIQVSDSDGEVRFATIFPGWYQGRATHIHVQVYVNGQTVKTTQIAFPEAIIASVYAQGVYASHGQNPMSNEADMVFGDGDDEELASMSGDASSGFIGVLAIDV